MKRKTKFKILGVIVVAIIIGFVIPQSFVMPVEGATQKDYNHNTFWYYPWGKSVTHKGVDIFAKEGTVLRSISADRINKDSVICSTALNVATHSSLKLVITEKTVRPSIDLISITPSGEMLFYCIGGEMTIDKSSWEKGILKAIFDFKFDDENPNMQTYWKGKIYAEIKSFF